ncbi:hypothetical protein A4H97_28570 [Niastella yeongjuensis]|uniref:Outer membrane protein beta-barrel domain-containing protein n=1 Tax=Niastella yeongjuensis TaxID=354355 RepID=A0A1V9ET24_9BACT|nr:hypothetical protein [Niastella yeongjuensis]OQP49298.1 hypothetical protein A4H97_28570 [Niastella yeongjuensis]SEP43090.1 hypothetical protein SAMN05660816_06057 [Niastella yeongjuensis]
MSNSRRNAIIAIAFLVVPFFVAAQSKYPSHKGEFYFSWGYNKEWYTQSNLHIVQPELNSDYTFKGIRAHDHPGWDEGLFNRALTIPQYNYRIGYFFKDDLGIEINFDHTKYIIDHQDAHRTGKKDGKPLDETIKWNEENGFYYFLNNGANFLLFNIVKRWHLYEQSNQKVRIDMLGKAGVGPVVPHVDNQLDGFSNNPDFQIGGWNLGVEQAIRATFYKYVYLEFAHKIDYARYGHLNIYKGEAHQAFGTYELILNLGVNIPGKKK